MALSSTSFVNGQIGNPNGRPLGSRNKRTKEIINQIIQSGNKDPLLTLSEISSSDLDSSVRAAAANMLAPYMHSKMQSTPAPRFIEESIDIPLFTHLSDAEQFLAKITALVGQGRLDIQTGLELSSLAKAWLDAQYAREELAIKQINAGTTEHEQRIVISGGLPTMQGLEGVLMPQLNGEPVTNVPATPQEVNRGAAYLDGMLFRGTQDARVLAYDFKTGKRIWETAIGDPKKGESAPAAPIAKEKQRRPAPKLHEIGGDAG